jgi:dihydroflavonol-4-reductase
VVVLVPTAVFGPGDIKPTTGVVIRDAARGRIPVYFDATINAVDVRDVARSHIEAVQHGQRAERYILGGTNLLIHDVLRLSCQAAGRPAPWIKLPRALIKGATKLTDALPFMHVPENFRTFEFWQPVSSQKAETQLHHTVRPFEETVRDTVAWFDQFTPRAATR